MPRRYKIVGAISLAVGGAAVLLQYIVTPLSGDLTGKELVATVTEHHTAMGWALALDFPVLLAVPAFLFIGHLAGARSSVRASIATAFLFFPFVLSLPAAFGLDGLAFLAGAEPNQAAMVHLVDSWQNSAWFALSLAPYVLLQIVGGILMAIALLKAEDRRLPGWPSRPVSGRCSGWPPRRAASESSGSWVMACSYHVGRLRDDPHAAARVHSGRAVTRRGLTTAGWSGSIRGYEPLGRRRGPRGHRLRGARLGRLTARGRRVGARCVPDPHRRRDDSDGSAGDRRCERRPRRAAQRRRVVAAGRRHVHAHRHCVVPLCASGFRQGPRPPSRPPRRVARRVAVGACAARCRALRAAAVR